MKSLTFVGFLLFGIGALLFYMNNKAIDLNSIYGMLCGIGIGLISGGIVGYVSKGSAIKREEKQAAFKQLEKEKKAYEKQQALLTSKEESYNNDQQG